MKWNKNSQRSLSTDIHVIQSVNVEGKSNPYCFSCSYPLSLTGK